MKRPILLVILDGFGLSLETKGNAIALAEKPNFQEISAYYPGTALQAAGLSVGIPWGEMGNSEVGHTALGAGLIVYQDFPRISMAIESGAFSKMPIWEEAIKCANKNKSSIHLMGIFSNSGVHGHIDHLFALMEIIADSKIRAPVFIHLFTDGRDSSPNSAPTFLAMLDEKIKKLGIGAIATLSGRYYAMDRNQSWDRTQKSYDALTLGNGHKFKTPKETIEFAYNNKLTDEYIEPSVIVDNEDRPIGRIKNNDVVIFYNFRPDRARQLTNAFVSAKFEGFEREKLTGLFFVAMTEYDPKFAGKINVAFQPKHIGNPLAKVLSENGIKQLHIAETEKYAHVTYFFNGGREEPFEKEDRVLIPSPAVPRYDLKPEMSAYEITDALVEYIDGGKYDFIVANFANADMVAHTGNLDATVKAINALDVCIGRLYKKVLEKDWLMIITSDHGNAEEMINLRTDQIDTEHSTHPVPFWLVGDKFRQETLPSKPEEIIVGGILVDVAPTILDLMELKKPREMVGESLIDRITKVSI